MEQFKHKVCGIYPDQAAAHQAQEKLRSSGYPEQQIRLINPHDPDPGIKLEPEGRETVKEVAKDAGIGAAAGGGLGVVGSAAMGAAEVALFITHPVLATLMIAGYGATIAGLVGAATGIRIKETDFVGIAEDALKKGHWVLIALAKDTEEEKTAHDLIAETAAEREEDI